MKDRLDKIASRQTPVRDFVFVAVMGLLFALPFVGITSSFAGWGL